MTIRQYLGTCMANSRQAIAYGRPYVCKELKQLVLDYLDSHKSVDSTNFDDIQALETMLMLVMKEVSPGGY